jgi:hypothetical protein
MRQENKVRLALSKTDLLGILLMRRGSAATRAKHTATATANEMKSSQVVGKAVVAETTAVNLSETYGQ